jgi:hypothetical protein
LEDGVGAKTRIGSGAGICLDVGTFSDIGTSMEAVIGATTEFHSKDMVGAIAGIESDVRI